MDNQEDLNKDTTVPASTVPASIVPASTGSTELTGSTEGKKRSGIAGANRYNPDTKFRELKQAFIEAFFSQEVGGVEGLITWAVLSNENRTNFYKFVVQMMPKDLKLSGDGNAPIARKVVIEVKDSSMRAELEEVDDGPTIDLHMNDQQVAEAAHEAFPEHG